MQDLSNSNIIHVKDKNIEYIQFKKLLKYKEVKHAITLKPYDFYGIANYDKNKEEVNKNYKNLCMSIGVCKEKIIRAKQTHTDNIEIVSKNNIGIFPKSLDDVDGLITNEKELALSLVFADCIPLIFYDPVKKVISNVHSGWKGTCKKIGTKATRMMIKEFNCEAKDILCFVGPSIGKCHFEVDEDVYKTFKESFKDLDNFENMVSKKIDAEGKQKYYIDTVKINRCMLENIGLLPENIIESNICTVCNYNYIHSFRYDKEKSGRMTSVVSLV